MKTYECMINGELISSEKTWEVKNPATGESLGYAPVSTAEDIQKAVSSAKNAQPSLSAKSASTLFSSVYGAFSTQFSHHTEKPSLTSSGFGQNCMADCTCLSEIESKAASSISCITTSFSISYMLMILRSIRFLSTYRLIALGS